ncbi:3-5 exonuclease domain containing protein [Theileria equi strain WA]|uniref:3-5 exonuclease domain containing protein n=1 Tax=Theileria equi strain WA TaxID=1537102 RepID=L0ATL2_THEEQ|nr:3-5 exonuclease domain containing protein [Theileria equi strain WA]AFZ78982.1 3-5 exonuclease domain containing protein [Theileria equi strain WA]|eukprot:XP_004828648.1 3-5 exonuclease domain containing protein [Theileria equi strain WA]
MAILWLKLALLVRLGGSFTIRYCSYKNQPSFLFKLYSTAIQFEDPELAVFKGKNIIIDNTNVNEYNTSVEQILNTRCVGFDLEYLPDYYASIREISDRRKPSLVQICGDSTCLIYLIYKIGYIPLSLLNILNNTNILKVSHGAPSDMLLLYRHFGTICTNFVDLLKICRENKIHPTTLQNATAHVLNLKLSKRQQCSNWEAKTLTTEQIAYASTDAWVTRQIYLQLSPSKVDKLFINSNGEIETA